MAAGDSAPHISVADLSAFLRVRADVPAPFGAPLIASLNRLRGSEDPVVTFGRLPRACVPEFADGCQVELSDGTEPSFRAGYPEVLADGREPAAARSVGSDHILATPFQAAFLAGYPSYAGVVTHWWTDSTPSGGDSVLADLMVKHLVALVDHERMMAVVARAEDRAAKLALGAISGRTINVATGIVMHQNQLGVDDAEDLLRQSAEMTGQCLHQLAAGVVRAGRLGIGRLEDNGGRRSAPGQSPP
jgi:ANTAR domain-containing protein